MDFEQFGGLAGRVVARLARHVERSVADFDLTLPQYRVLGLLAEGDSASSRLAEKLAVTRSSISSVVDGLVARGLVERGARAKDRRQLPLALTPDGERVLADANIAVGQRLGRILDTLDEPEAESVRISFDHLRVSLDRQRARKMGIEPR